MSKRIKFKKSDQRDFFSSVKEVSGLSWAELASYYGFSERSFRDWARAKFTVPYDIGRKLSKRFGLELPRFKELPEYWYIAKGARKGGLERHRIYGLVGSIESRRKGGLISQRRRLENPEKYRLLGCKVRKIVKPLKTSLELAELCGIILGDGGITNTQVKITLNKKTDKDYAIFVSDLVRRVLKERPSTKTYGSVAVVMLSGEGYVEALERVGLRRGNKVKHQVGIPSWILNNKKYSVACLRGLVDTDGGVYFHHHVVSGKRYINFGLSFCSASLPLIHDSQGIFERCGIKVYRATKRKLYVYKMAEIKKYFELVGSSNSKHIRRLESYINMSRKFVS